MPRIHDIEALLGPTRLRDQVEVTVEESRLPPIATVTRCPGDHEPVSYEEAAHALELAAGSGQW